MENKEEKFGLSTCVCIFNKDFSKVLLIKRNKEKREKYRIDWTNAGGKIEFGESSKDACLREIKEETGLNLKISDLRLTLVKEDTSSFKDFHLVLFVYSMILEENQKMLLNHESEECQWFDLNSLPEKVSDKDLPLIAQLSKEKWKK